MKFNDVLFFYSEISPTLQPKARRLMLLLNPCGGRGNALQQCHTHILPIITEADISYNLVQTGRAFTILFLL